MDENTHDTAAPPPAPPAAEFARVIEEDADGLILFDAGLRFTYVNARAERHLGRPRDALLGRALWDALPELADAPDYELLPRALAERTPVVYEIESRLSPGRWFEVRAVPTGGEATALMVYLRDITDRKRGEEEVALLADLVRLSRDAMIVRALDGTVLSLNPAAERLYGYTEDEARGRRTHDLLRTRFPVPLEEVERALREEGAWAGELVHTRKDGATVVVSSRQTLRRDEDDPDRLLVLESNRDVTEQRRTRQRLEESLARLTFHVENSPLAVIEFDSEFRVVSWSGQAESLFGWTADEVVGRRPDEWRFVHDEDAAEADGEVARLLGGEAERSVQVNRNYTKDGGVRLFQWNNSVLRADDGRVESVLSLGLDLTEQWEGEKALIESMDALRLSEQRYHSLVEATAAVVWTTDAEGRFVEPQASWARYTGQGWPAHSGFSWADMVHPDDRERIGAQWRRAVEGRVPLIEIEGRMWHAASGRYRFFVARGVPVFDPDGTLREWVGTVSDVDEQRRAEAERAERAARTADIAETLQRSLLIAPAPADFSGLDVYTHYEPASDDALVGGDFFDAFAIGEPGGKVALVIGDVTGKGLNAAAETAEVKFTLRAYLREYPWPQVALQRLNEYLIDRQRLENKPTDVFISVVTVIVDRRSGEATAALGGMEPPLVLRSSPGGSGPPRPEEVPARGLMLGALPEWDGLPIAFTLHPGDVLLLCSDGLTEARLRRGSRGMFGIEGVTQAALAALQDDPAAPLGRVSAAVADAARAYAGGRLQDDACLLLARLEPGGAG